MKKLRSLKKGLAILLTAAMVVGLMPGVGALQVSAETAADVWNGTTASSFAGGSGTPEDPYQIATGAQLAYFAKVINATAYADNEYAKAYFKLTADIDLNHKTLGPIGKGNSCFSVFNGCFDGNHKTISNYSGSYGLFYYVGGDVTIKDLTLANVNISGSSYIGGLVYMVYANKGTSARISNCHISGTITSTNAAVGLVYRADSPLTIENCSNSANITGQIYIAGILGGNNTSSTSDDYSVIIRNSSNSGKIVNTSTSSSGKTAGIAADLKSGKTLIENCVNRGEIVAKSYGDKYAGIVSYSGSTEGNTIRNCENYGNVTCDVAKTNIYTAGICAYASYTEIYDCSNAGTIHNYESALYCGGIVARRASSSDDARGSVYNCLNVGTIEPSYGGQIIGSEDTLSNVYDNYYVNGNLAANSVNNQNNYRISQEQAESGYLAYVLNGMTNGNVWKQKLGTDTYPKINGSEDVVYANGNCSAKVTEYSNTPLDIDTDKNHDLILVSAKDADCGHNGYREHYECKTCHAFFENDTDNIPVRKSDFITGEATGNHLAYDTNGLCDVCGNAYQKPETDGSGVYIIKNTGNFIWYANAINNYNYISIPVGDAEIQLDGFDAKLEADIDLSLVYNEESGKSWEPIAYDYSKYLNELDGQGHTINGLYINSASLNYAGLVETMYYKTAYIHDIVFTNVNINAPRAAYVGTVAGKLESLKTAPCIENCIVESGTINGKTYVGGLAGYVCSNNADKFTQENKNIINNCANFANVNSTSYAGGLVGYTEANGKNVNIANCYNVGTITGGTSGDLVGKIDANTTVVNCYHIGDNAFGENSASATAEQKRAEQFASGEVAYLLQSGQAVDGEGNTPEVWGQKLGEVGDAYPVLGGTPVYRNETYAGCEDNKGEPTNIVYSNTEEDAVYAEHTDSNEDGKCDYCGRYIGIIQNKDYPTEIAYCDEAVTPQESNFTINSGATPLTFTWYKGDLTTVDKLPTEGDDFIGTTAPAAEGVYTLVVTAPAVEGETSYTAAELRLKIEIVRVALAGSVKIGGTVKCGETLTVDTSSITNVKTGILSYQWYHVDGDTKTAIGEATNTTYTLTGDDVGKKIAVEVTSQYCTGALEDKTETAVEKIAGTAAITSTTQSLSKEWDNAVVSIPTFTTSNDTGTENANVTFEYKKSTETEYVQTAPSDAGTYHVRVRVAEDATHGEAVSEPIEFTISKVDATVVTGPKAATGLTYQGGEAITLIDDTGVHVTGGEIRYALGAADGTYSKALPTATDAGEYQVYYKVVGDNNHNDTTPVKIDVTVEQATPDYTIPTDLTANCGDKLSSVTLTDGFVWTDDASATLEAGDTESGQTVSKTAKFVPTDKKNYIEVTGIAINIKVVHTYANGVCSVCDKIWEETIHGITYRTITDEVDGKPVGKLVTVSGNDIPQVAVAVTGTDDTLSEYISDGKVTVPSEVTGSGCEQTFVVTKISENAFKDAEVTEIVVPATVTEVGSGAFGSATTITFNGSTVPDGIAGAISEAVTTVNVPEGAADSFREALKDVLGENVTIKEIHTHTFDTKWTYDATYHWHAATCKHTEEIADQAEHTFGIWVTVTEATEDAEGVKERSCCCGYKETAKIDKLAHTTHVKDNGTRVEPTCEKKGSITYKCTKCDKVMEVVEIPATGHKWDAGKVTKEPTLAAEGEKTYTCSVCGATKTEVIPKKEAAAPQPPKKGDVAKDDKGTGDYKVTDVTKKEVAYQTPADQNAATISVPATATIDSVTYKVTSIADNAFANNKKLTKVTIGSNIKTIGKKAFYKCTKLKTVKIGKNVTTIGSNAFYGCSKLTTAAMGANVTTIGDKAFYKCTSLTKITIPSKVKKIGKQAFYGCKKLKSITIKTTKLTGKNVGSKAFKGIYAKATIKVPKSKVTSYKKILKAKGVSSKAKIKK